VQFEVLEGKAAETIIEYAHTQDVKLIMMSSHGQSGISGWNVSSVVQKIIQRAQTSIMIVRAYRPLVEAIGELHYNRILVPLDCSQRSEIVLPAAIALAREHGSDILIAHVIKKPEMPRRTPPSIDDIELANQLIERNRIDAVQHLDELKSRQDVKIDISLVVGENVTTSLHKIVDENNIDLVFLSAHGYSGDTKWLYGSTVISFIVYGTTPLLVVRIFPLTGLNRLRQSWLQENRGGAKG
jgi:nucleotide-binding universal stress UspA family protein